MILAILVRELLNNIKQHLHHSRGEQRIKFLTRMGTIPYMWNLTTYEIAIMSVICPLDPIDNQALRWLLDRHRMWEARLHAPRHMPLHKSRRRHLVHPPLSLAQNPHASHRSRIDIHLVVMRSSVRYQLTCLTRSSTSRLKFDQMTYLIPTARSLKKPVETAILARTLNIAIVLTFPGMSPRLTRIRRMMILEGVDRTKLDGFVIRRDLRPSGSRSLDDELSKFSSLRWPFSLSLPIYEQHGLEPDGGIHLHNHRWPRDAVLIAHFYIELRSITFVEVRLLEGWRYTYSRCLASSSSLAIGLNQEADNDLFCLLFWALYIQITWFKRVILRCLFFFASLSFECEPIVTFNPIICDLWWWRLHTQGYQYLIFAILRGQSVVM